MAVDLMSSLFKYPSQTAPVKIGPVKRAGQTCKPAKREKGQKRSEMRGERRGERGERRERERECVCVKRASPRDGSHFRREEMRGERWRGERVSPRSSLRRNLFPTRERARARDRDRERERRDENREREAFLPVSPRDGISVAREEERRGREGSFRKERRIAGERR